MGLVSTLASRIKTGRKRILFIGDIVIDRWVHGTSVDTCQEGCNKFIVNGAVVDTPGGAANAERSISHWEVNTDCFGQPVDVCPVKYRFVGDDGKIVYRADFQEPIPGKLDSRFVWKYNLAREMLSCADGVLMSDYDKGFLTPGFIGEIIETCKRRSVPCVADCKRPPGLYAGAILKGNDKYWGKYNYTNNMLGEKGQAVVTFGSICPTVWNGPKGFGAMSLTTHLPPVKCVNHVGAGDCFAAHLTLGLAYGLSLKEAAGLAHSAGRVYVQHPHNRPPTLDEIEADLALVSNPEPANV